ncbi:MAG: PadR family transcriptional regulator [Frankiales bacterium]|jgi:DNA-binding PadR family transcriptional regulator|nr:PadR family transcriptional regulator [Frankiales bacterium]
MARSSSRWADPGLLVLGSLADGEKHGYAIAEDIEQRTGRRPGPGTLYGAIARLEQDGLITALEGDARRRPYRLSGDGARVLQAELSGMRAFANHGLRGLRGRMATS